MKLVPRLLAGLALLSVPFGCESVAGIEDRRYEAPVTGSPECEAYCTEIGKACTGQHAQFASRAACIRVCDEYPRGEASPQNTLECRRGQVTQALQTNEPGFHCPAAGPYGAGKCGSPCQAYCSLWGSICPEDAKAIAACEKTCAAVPQTGAFSLSSGDGGDTIECRLSRLSAAALDSAECKNAALIPRAACNEPLDAVPSCEHYCAVVAAACEGPLAVFENEQQCQDVCKALPLGTYSHTVENTVGCRIYHAYNSFAAPGGHCSHAGPSGDGHCGLDQGGAFGSCESYCLLLEQACASDFAGKFSSQLECMTDCVSLGDSGKADQGYDLLTAPNKKVQCRILNTARALSEASACPQAMGDGC